MATGLFFAGLHVVMRLCAHSPLINEVLQSSAWPDLQSEHAWLWFAGVILLECVLLGVLLQKGIAQLRHGHFS